MWHFLLNPFKLRDEGSAEMPSHHGGMEKIGVRELATFCRCFSDRLLIVDLREFSEIEDYPYAIPGALLTTRVDVTSLISWIPRHTMAVFYTMEDVPLRFARLSAPSHEIKLYVLRGGLRSWRQSGLPMEALVLASCKPFRAV